MSQPINNEEQKTNNFSQTETDWTPPRETDETSKNIIELTASIRILEDRYLNLRKKSQLTDQNLIELQKEYFKEKKHINQELMESKIKLQELLEDLKIMKGELKDTVKQKELLVINKYLDFWEPIQFVTRKEIEQLKK